MIKLLHLEALLVAVFMISACGAGDNPSPAPKPSPTVWMFQYSNAVSGPFFDAQDNAYFDFPADCAVNPMLGYKPCSANYLVQSRTAPLSGDAIFNLGFRLDGSGQTSYLINLNNTCGPGSPATVRPYFQRQGDNLSGEGEYEFYRWFGPPLNLAGNSGVLQSSTSLGARDQWIDVWGYPATDNAAAFAAALASPSFVGLVFGGGCFASHGANAIGGPVRFTLTSFGVN